MNQGSGDDEGFAALFEKAGTQGVRQRRMSVGDEVEGVVVKVGRDEVFLDLDGKREAFIERIALVAADGTPLELNPGDTIVARVAELEGRAGTIRLEPVSVRRAASDDPADEGVSDDEAQVALVGGDGPRLATGAHVMGEVARVETYGVFVQIEGTTGRQGRGLVPAVETGFPRGTDLRKKFPLGQKLEVKILAIGDDGKIRMSVRALKADEERATYEQFSGKDKPGGGAGFGTLAAAFSKGKANKPGRR